MTNNNTEFETIIGIEVHAQLKTKTKAFCGCSNIFDSPANTNVCPVCLGMPGALPVLNKQVVRMAILTGLSLNCEIKEQSVFSRKNYFYPDLPKGYQISQFDLPICLAGSMNIVVEGQEKQIGITRIHIEEDAGKLLHQGAESIAESTSSLIDFNRSSVPLIEIVTEPDMRSAKEARAFLESLRLNLQYLGVCAGNLEEGSMRADVNVSLRPVGQEKFGTRAEVKNINSYRSLERAIASEVERQKEILLAGGKVEQETRNYQDATRTTTSLRSKANAHDYRYFPEPDLAPLILDKKYIENIKNNIPELPAKKIIRFQEELNLAEYESTTIVNDIDKCQFFEACLNAWQNSVDSNLDLNSKILQSPDFPKEFAKWILGDLSALIKEKNTDLANSKINPINIINLVYLVKEGKLSNKMAKEMLPEIFKPDIDFIKLSQQSGTQQISDESSLIAVIKKVLAANEDAVQKIKTGNMKPIGFLMGQVMKETKGQAKPDTAKNLIINLINN
jgi:aspartyl-tRNA(Asn)/glutamyl-tRNA(Gln) amidotransferase subunit B